jgi:hypothetical protein
MGSGASQTVAAPVLIHIGDNTAATIWTRRMRFRPKTWNLPLFGRQGAHQFICRGAPNRNLVTRPGPAPGRPNLMGERMEGPPFKGRLSGRKPVSDYVNKAFSGHFSASNARLKAIAGEGFDLSDYL